MPVTAPTAPAAEPTVTAIVEKPETRSLKPGEDRCDSCGAEGWVRVTMANGPLILCGHHYAKNEDVLMSKALKISDQRHFINATSESSA